MKYNIQTGGVLEAETPTQIVEQLKQSRFTESQTLQEYMLGFAHRYTEYYNKTIRFDSVDNFVEDLLKDKYLVEVK